MLRHQHRPPKRLPAPPPPPPLVTLRAPDRAAVVLTVLPSPAGSGIADSVSAALQRDFEQSDWLTLLPQDSAAGAVATIRVTPGPTTIAVALIDARSQRLYRSQTFPVPPPPVQGASLENPDSAGQIAWEARRWALHGIADAVLAWVTGQTGIAQSRIAYVTRSAVHVVDWDGANDRSFVGSGIALSPAWSHDGRTLVYSTLTSAGTHIVELDLSRGSSTPVTTHTGGLNITPVYSPDDRWIVFANGDERGTTLIAVRRNGGGPKVILRRRGFDNSSPTFSPDGRRIAFVSARPKTPQIYSVNADGTGERLETPFSPTVRSYRASPDWSPDGASIAFEQQNGDFQLWLLTLATHTMRRVTMAGDNEDPSWAPDSRHLAFTAAHKGRKDIWTLDTMTGRLRQVTYSGSARLAAWSPVLTKN